MEVDIFIFSENGFLIIGVISSNLGVGHLLGSS
jgi:hypothetical protein